MPSREFDSLEAIVERFLVAGPRGDITAACVGIAGPVVDGRAVTPNLPWVVDERRLAAAIPAPRVRLLNDLEATAHGIWALGEDELVSLQSGTLRRGNLAVIAAGTGLGEAIVVIDGGRRTVFATEGGHADFAPRSELEEDLLRYLRKEFGRVSYERVLSGPGLVNVYRFLRDTGVAGESSPTAERMAAGDPAAVITELGLDGADRLCAMALALFVSVYGAEAGNLALKAPGRGRRDRGGRDRAADFAGAQSGVLRRRLPRQGPARLADGDHPRLRHAESEDRAPRRRPRGRLSVEVGGPEMAPHTPQRSSRPE